jgi:hypothetical protein
MDGGKTAVQRKLSKETQPKSGRRADRNPKEPFFSLALG